MSQDFSIDEVISRISKFASALGISRNELKIYFLLLLNGKMTAKEISDKLGISYTKVYPFLSRLEGRGWIKRSGKKPAYYTAISLLEVWSNVKRNIVDSLDKVEREIITPLSLLLTSQPSMYNILFLPPESVYFSLIEMLKSPSNIYYVALSFPELFNDEVIKLLESNSYKSEVKIILSKTLKGSFPPSLQIKYTDSMFGSGVITSKGMLLIIKSSEGVLFGLYSSHAYFIEIGKVYFNYLWNIPTQERGNV
ncbi:MAG: helix-turn-helix domain-containing protein [Sulfolobus sp.]